MSIKLTYIHFIGTKKVCVEINMLYTTYRAWGPYARGVPGNYPVCPYVKTALDIMNIVYE